MGCLGAAQKETVLLVLGLKAALERLSGFLLFFWVCLFVCLFVFNLS